MKTQNVLSLVLIGLVSVWAPTAVGHARAQEKPKVQVQIPQPGVPQIMTMEGKFVRAAYNNEGYVILGYQLANRSIGEEWMLLEVGMTVLDRVPDYKLTRDALSLETPDGKTIPLPSISEHREGNTRRCRTGRRSSATRSTTFRRARAGRAARLLPRPGLSRDAVRRGRAEQPARLPRPALSSRCRAASSTASTGST